MNKFILEIMRIRICLILNTNYFRRTELGLTFNTLFHQTALNFIP